MAGLIVTPDGTQVVARADGVFKLFSIATPGSEPTPLRGFEAGVVPLRFAADGRSLLVRRPAPNRAAQVLRVDPVTGTRTPVRLITPIVEATGIGQLQMTADASAYVYGYGVTHSDLFLVKGLR